LFWSNCFLTPKLVAKKIVLELSPFLIEKTSGLAAGSRVQDSNYQTLPTMNFKTNFSKGQLISKCLFGVFNSSKNEQKQPEVS
jgi:hypothetical protein